MQEYDNKHGAESTIMLMHEPKNYVYAETNKQSKELKLKGKNFENVTEELANSIVEDTEIGKAMVNTNLNLVQAIGKKLEECENGQNKE